MPEQLSEHEFELKKLELRHTERREFFLDIYRLARLISLIITIATAAPTALAAILHAISEVGL